MRFELEGKRQWSEPVMMEALSERYGWTPQQIRDMDPEDLMQYLEILSEMNRIEKMKRLKQK